MPPFDPIASPAVRAAAHREPAFVFAEEAAIAQGKLAEFVARTGRRPNILFILFDDVGWGDRAEWMRNMRKLAYLEVLREGMRQHLGTFRTYPPKRVMGLAAGG